MAKSGYQSTNPNDGDKLTDPNAITETDPASLANARANAGIGDGTPPSGAPAEDGGSGGSAEAESTTDRVGAANAGDTPARIAGTEDNPDKTKPAKTGTTRGTSSR